MDFDLVGTGDYVLYDYTLQHETYEDVTERYKDIVCFQELLRIGTIREKDMLYFREKNISHLEEYVQEFKDQRLKNKIKMAMQELWYSQRNTQDYDRKIGARGPIYETSTFSIFYVSHFAENRYGIHFKDTDQYAIYGFFFFDDGKQTECYYRSDEAFKKEQRLHTRFENCNVY